MNARQLRKIGVPDHCVAEARRAIEKLAKISRQAARDAKVEIPKVLEDPKAFVDHDAFAELASALIEDAGESHVPGEPVTYRTWGEEGIDAMSFEQMENACRLPISRAAALMPDAHVGYGLPIGGVLATENAVIPYAVGVDIACRMKLSVLDMPVDALDSKFHAFKDALEKGTRFGVGVSHERKQSHDVMDADWSVSKVTRERKDKAWKQLGTSGSGNHFVEFGVFTIEQRDEELGLDAGEYVSLLSHSGSRGVGAAVCSTYSGIASAQLPKRFASMSKLAWLDLDSHAGQEYWAAMNLMGDYASANHEVIHRLVTKLIGATVISGVENHHNFAWKETHGDKELIVHRKGATPAGEGVLGVIPGSMADPAFVVRGLGNAESLNSAAHGAGRVMSRKKAKATFNWKGVRDGIERKNVRVISAGIDEVPGVYKNIREVMSHQQDLVETVARFDPRIVKMCDDGSRPED
ncbi:MAG: RtcB family protein [Planctomycetes bacterium]|nr:RtcB family protein [Planctomycetota bacterium]